MKKLYSFDDHPEHKAQLDAWAQRWIDNAFACGPADRDKMIGAVNGLYDAATLPQPLNIAFVRSPLSLAVAGGIAAGVWWLRENPGKHTALFGRTFSEGDLMAAVAPSCAWAIAACMGRPRPFPLAATRAATRDATWAATRAATRAATEAATRDATRDATWDATEDATEAATWAATEAATWDATRDATRDATEAATRDATWDATWDATEDRGLIAFLVRCTGTYWRMYDGGSDWSAWPSYLSFFDHVAGLDIPIFEKWRHYETAALNGGGRVMHAKFCIVADRHTEIRLDVNNQLHREDGPAKVYGDGWALNYWHGVRVPDDFHAWDLKRALSEGNQEIKRCAIERLGWDLVLERCSLVAEAPDPGNAPHIAQLYDLPNDLQVYGERARLYVVSNASLDKGGARRLYALPVPASQSDPVAAGALLFDVPKAAYAKTVRAS